MNKEPERYFLDTDNDCHWYLIPVSKKAKWYKWLDSNSDDSPDYVKQIGGAPNIITFIDPKYEE